MGNLIAVIWMLFAEYVLVFLAILTDLWSGVRKAKLRGEARTSYGFRRTVDKLARYYSLLLMLTIIDAMHVSGFLYVNKLYGYNIPLVPIITFIGSIGLGLIELKSIYEKAEDKDMRRVSDLAYTLLKDKNNAKALTKIIVEYLNEKDNEGPN